MRNNAGKNGAAELVAENPMEASPRFIPCSATLYPVDSGVPQHGGTIDGSANRGVRRRHGARSKRQRTALGAYLRWHGPIPEELAAAERLERISNDERRHFAARGEQSGDSPLS